MSRAPSLHENTPGTFVGGLELDLDAFEGPFDLLLTLVLREELPLSDVDLVEVVLAFIDHLRAGALGAGAEGFDLDACGEFLILISALLELKARGLFPDEAAELDELEPEEAAEELARRLAAYRQAKSAAAWLADRLHGEGARYFRLGPAPFAPSAAEPTFARQDPVRLAKALRALAIEPPAVSTGHMALRFPPVAQFIEKWCQLLRRRAVVDFDQEVAGLTRVEVAVAFLALLELSKEHLLTVSQASAVAPIRITRAEQEGGAEWTARSA